ncbi:MAG: MotA/TolQ/ExbB proton channel family protein [Bacteroidales bacterium]|jgi:biopolymer transport protein ExbB|nr:MotA/TolQ/ExbB proton channel family protein [Bacteroidales bacterium]OPZ98672.1 MAG: colicin uptake protein TolQ [Bacteroidetes bacterium ADurb.Bin416]
MNLLLTLQTTAAEALPTLSTLETTTLQPEPLRFFDMAVKGGWLMLPLVLLLLIAIYLFVERLLTINAASKEDPSFMNRIKDHILNGNIESAIKLCKQTNTPSSRMIEKGITRIGRPMNDVQVAIENMGNIEVSKLERGLSVLASVSGGAPMIGFLGTVLGMVQAFYDMASAGSNVDISILSSGIYVAMVTTVAGLIVGILAYFANNYLVSRIRSLVTNLETRTMEFMDLLHEPTKL